MVKVELPREVKGSYMLEKLEESAKELGYSTERDCRGGYVIVPGSVKEKLTKLRLYITTSIPRKQNWLRRLLGDFYDVFTSEVSINLSQLYKEIDMDVRVGKGGYTEYLTNGTRGWEKVKPGFEKLIDGLYNKLK